MSFKSINPASGQTIKTYEETSQGEVNRIIKEANHAFLKWRRVSFTDRSEKMKKAAKILRTNRDDYAKLMTLEMGKPIKQSELEIDKCAWTCEYFANRADSLLRDEVVTTDASKSYIHFEPLGVILAIMPWNFPFWQVFRCAAPSLMAGNVMVLKHASNVSGCAVAIQGVFRQAGFPEGIFSTLLLSSARVAQLIKSPGISAVTLTGSTTAGRAVASTAGKLLKKTVLELGGSDPYLVLEDAELEAAVETCVTARLGNTGQSCIAAKRFIVVKNVREDFERLLVERMKREKLGDPMDRETTVGPLARLDLRDELHKQVKKSVDKGAKVLLGGKVPKGKGVYYPPTVLGGVKKGMAVYHEETFGPVASIIEAKDEKDAVRIANDTSFGLGAAVFTKDKRRGERIAARELEAGNCFVNAQVKSDPRLPFGGIKQSGYGRELGVYGIKEFVNVKTVCVR